MQLTYTEGDLRPEEYRALREAVGWDPFSKRQAALALQNSLYVLSARDGGRPIGMGRLVGDGATICYVQDLIVLPAYRRAHVGTALLRALERFARGLLDPGETMRLCLMCARGREAFYESCSFIARPTPTLGPGMIRYLYAAHGREEENP